MLNSKNLNIPGFDGCRNWYKGNVHCHTVNSDGCLTPEEVSKLYQDNGYHFLCISDHERYGDYREELNTENFINIPAVECSVNLMSPGNYNLEEKLDEKSRLTREEWLKGREDMDYTIKTHHIHGILGTEEMQRTAENAFTKKMEDTPVYVYANEWDGRRAAQKQIDDLKNRGCLVMYNHPLWSKVTQKEYLELEGVWAVEIYNHSTVLDSGLGLDTHDWDIILGTGRQIFGVASDDNHNTRPIPDSCGGWVVVNANCLNQEDIIENLKKGNFYSSSGPEIYDWGIRNGKAYVECSECERINFICGGALLTGVTKLAGQEGWLTEKERIEHRKFMTGAEYELTGLETYIRVECVDKDGKTAWSNAIMFGDNYKGV